MFLLLLSTFLVGISVPIAAILVKNQDALVFAFFFLLILILVQLPFMYRKRKEILNLKLNKEIPLLAISGFVATLFYWCEFSSLKVGLPVSHVSFLTLTVPAWVIFYEYTQGSGTVWSVNKLLMAVAGSVVMILPEAGGTFTLGHTLPVFTSFLMAVFLISSKKSQDEGISPLVCSFFNDLLALGGVSALLFMHGQEKMVTTIPDNIGGIFLYALIIGLLPGLTMLYGLRKTKLMTAATVIMIEPVVFGILAVILNVDLLGLNFLIGAVLITLSNMPDNFFYVLKKVRVIYALNTFK